MNAQTAPLAVAIAATAPTADAAFPLAGDPILLLTAHATAMAESINISTLWRRVRSGQHPAPVKLGGSTRFVRAEIDAYIQRAIAVRDAAKADTTPATTQEGRRHG